MGVAFVKKALIFALGAASITMVSYGMPMRAYAASAYPVKQDQIELNGQAQNHPYGLVANNTTYMPIWYVTEALKQIGIRNTWDGQTLSLLTPAGTKANLQNVNPGYGDMSIYIDGTLIQHVTGITALDPSSHQMTTYMPIWYVMQALNRMNLRSDWNGTLWDIWSTPLFGTAFNDFIKSRQSTVSVAVYDANNGQTYLSNSGLRFDTASIVKATIMADLLHQSKVSGQPLSSSELSLMVPMIEYSDNAAASALWNDAGGSAGIDNFLKLAGMDETTPGQNGYWGLTQTSVLDQVKLMRDYAYPNSLLSPAERAYGLHLMENVVSWERWGVSGGVASGATVALKNGWLPIGAAGWEINSIGYINGDGRNYTIAVLTRSNPSESYGINTVAGISRILWQEL